MAFIEAAADDGTNFERVFAHRPEIHATFDRLTDMLRDTMGLRRYELATLAAARRLRSSYCMLAHGSVAVERLMSPEQLESVVTDHRAAGLEEVEVAIMDLADKVAGDATSVSQADVDRLRALGLSDADVLDVVLAAALRCVFSKTADGVGALPDAHFAERFPPALRDALTVGRPIAAP